MPCEIDDCPRPPTRRGMCWGHYAKQRRCGDPRAGRTYVTGGTPGEGQWERALRVLYGLTVEDYDRLLAEQGGVCAICRQPETRRKRRSSTEVVPLAVDHDHDTGVVRGLLCHTCNVRLGHVDDRAWLDRALAYLAA
jgi:hypothetical protein